MFGVRGAHCVYDTFSLLSIDLGFLFYFGFLVCVYLFV